MKNNEWQPVETVPVNKLVLIKLSYGIGSATGGMGKFRNTGEWYVNGEYLTDSDAKVIGWMELPLTHENGTEMDWIVSTS